MQSSPERSVFPRPPCTSGSPSWRRLGIILGYRAVVEPSAIALDVTALVGIEPGETSDEKAIVGVLQAMSEVESCYAVAGDQAFVVKVRVSTVDELHLLLSRIRAVPGVARTRTTVVLATWFEDRPAGLLQ